MMSVWEQVKPCRLETWHNFFVGGEEVLMDQASR